MAVGALLASSFLGGGGGGAGGAVGGAVQSGLQSPGSSATASARGGAKVGELGLDIGGGDLSTGGGSGVSPVMVGIGLAAVLGLAWILKG